MNPGKITVVIPTYNRAKLLPRAIESVLHQTHVADEIIVVDDGSTDNTAEIVKPYESSCVRYLKKQNGGPSSARNLGIESAAGEFIGFLDSDDEWQPTFLSQTCDLLQKNPSAAAVFTDSEIRCDDDGSIIEPSFNWGSRKDAFTSLLGHRRGWSGCFDRDTFRKAQIGVCLVVMSTTLVRAQAIEKTGLFDGRYQVSEDYEFWLRMSRYYTFCYIDQTLLISHVHGRNLSRQPKLYELFRRNNRLALKSELAWETDASIRRAIEDQLRKNWDTEIDFRLSQGNRTILQQTLGEARDDGWKADPNSMRRIKIVDRYGTLAGLAFARLLKWMGR